MWGCCGLCWRAFSDRRRLGPGHSIHPGILASCQPGRHLAAVPAHLSPEGHFPNICRPPTAPPCHCHNTHAHVTHHTTHTYLHTTHTHMQHTHAHTYTHVCTCAHVYTHTMCMHSMHTHAHMQTRVHMHAHIRARTSSADTSLSGRTELCEPPSLRARRIQPPTHHRRHHMAPESSRALPTTSGTKPAPPQVWGVGKLSAGIPAVSEGRLP